MFHAVSIRFNRTLILAVFWALLFSVQVVAQSPRPFIDTTSEWYITGWLDWGMGSDHWGFKMYIGGDTIIDSISHKIVYQTSAAENFYYKYRGGAHIIREDSAGKVYARDFSRDSSVYLDEFLLYDFGMQPGDTLVYYSDSKVEYCGEPDTVHCILDDIDTIMASGVPLRRFHMKRSTSPEEVTWLEGIGCIELGPFRPYCHVFEGGEVLTCFRNQSFEWKFNKGCFFLDVEEQEGAMPISCFPNPAGQLLYLQDVPSNCSYRIYNTNGQLQLTGFTDSKNEIHLEGLNPGMYQLILMQGEQMFWQTKFLKE